MHTMTTKLFIVTTTWALSLTHIYCLVFDPTEEVPLQQLQPSIQVLPSTEPPTPPPTTTIKPEIDMRCFHQSPEMCPTDKTNCKCRKLDPHYPQAVICCHVNNYFLLKEGLMCAGVGATDNVQVLHIYNATLDTLNVSQSTWKRLTSMSVTDGQIGRVVGEFPKWASISCFNLSNNNISDIYNRALVNLHNLSTLDLSHNNFDSIPQFIKGTKLLLDISANKPLQCYNVKETITEYNITFLHRNQTYCLSSKSFHWFNSTERLPLEQVEQLVELEEQCPEVNNQKCTCIPDRLDIVPGKPPTFAVKVDCSNRNLTKLPENIPPNTNVLNVSNNHIESLAPFSVNQSYQDIRQLYADNNEIKSILALEGTKFIDNFAVLSLKGNKLESLPTYLLSNMFDRNSIYRYVYLGHNRLICDCNTVKVLKVWLLTKQKNIPDYNEILCRNLPQKVMDLDQTKVCQYPRDWTDYIYYIIALEVLLLLGLIFKVSYDYWIFKTAGYLPWPANKMPKLPCDWLCET